MILAMIKSLDESVGQLTNAIKKLGIEDNTIIVFTSDNGHYKTENFIFTKPYRGQKGLTYEGGIRVPYIFKWKGHIKPKSVSKEPIIHVDLYPTLLSLSGNKTVDGYILDGEDISPILLDTNKKLNRDALVWEYTNYANYNIKRGAFASQWVNVIQMDGYKLTEVVDTKEYYMYNLNNDPYETKEVIKDFPKHATKMKERLEEWKIETGYVGPVPNPDYKGRKK
jgi:arylsulfatase A-like enzyme